ncbi:hypothetical protein EJB05_28270, partial [Eragrostis curvula]
MDALNTKLKQLAGDAIFVEKYIQTVGDINCEEAGPCSSQVVLSSHRQLRLGLPLENETVIEQVFVSKSSRSSADFEQQSANDSFKGSHMRKGIATQFEK